MKKIIELTFILLTTSVCFGQFDKRNIELNLGFEQDDPARTIPKDWVQWGTGYTIRVDKSIKRSGEASLLIESDGGQAQTSPGYAAYPIPSDFQAKEIELRAYMKLKNVRAGAAALLLRMDGAAAMVLSFDNTMGNNIQGTRDWAVYSLKKKFRPTSEPFTLEPSCPEKVNFGLTISRSFWTEK